MKKIKMKLKDIAVARVGIPINRYQTESGGEVKCFTLRSIMENKVNFDELIKIKASDQLNELYFSRKGDVILKLAAPNNAAAIEIEDKILIPQSFAIIRLRDEFIGKVDSKYLAYQLNSKEIKREMASSLEGGQVSILKIFAIDEIEITIIPYERQREYVKLWDLMGRQIEISERKAELYKIIRNEYIKI